MPEYIIFRSEMRQGSQGVDEKPVLRLQAESSEEACRRAAEEVLINAGQSLRAEPADPLDAKEENLNRRVEAL